jgi:integrase/recombinase XerD
LRAALSLPDRRGLRPWTYHCLLGLLSVTGMRVGEACNLELRDVDLRTSVLTIRSGKFGKSRLIPIHVSTRRVLADYLMRRKRWWGARPISSYLFVSDRGTQLQDRRIRQTFCSLSRQIGLRGPADSRGPRLHDMRHRFAAMTLLRWYRSGKNVEQKLPFLSAYLGHVCFRDTYWYLSAWPELMREAMSRLERRWEGQS